METAPMRVVFQVFREVTVDRMATSALLVCMVTGGLLRNTSQPTPGTGSSTIMKMRSGPTTTKQADFLCAVSEIEKNMELPW